MKLGTNGRVLMEHFEGKKAYLYDDSNSKKIAKAADAVGFPTIGIGHQVARASTEYDGVKLTEKQIQDLLDADIASAERILNMALNNGSNPITVTQNQFDALLSFIFNVGPGVAGEKGKDGFVRLKSGRTSTMYACLQRGDHVGVANQFKYWISSRGKPMDGLKLRRGAEAKLYKTPDGEVFNV